MEDGQWVTINGAHVFIKEGQHPMDAFIKQKGGVRSKTSDLTFTENEEQLLDYAVMDAGIMEYNDVLRNDYQNVPQNITNGIKDLNNLIDKSSLNQNMELYRYISDENVYKNLNVGDSVIEKGFMSTTYDKNSDRETDFKYSDTNNVKMIINAKKGEKAIDLSTKYNELAYEGSQESEILFKSGNKLTLTKKDIMIETNNGLKYISDLTDKEKRIYVNPTKHYVYWFDLN